MSRLNISLDTLLDEHQRLLKQKFPSKSEKLVSWLKMVYSDVSFCDGAAVDGVFGLYKLLNMTRPLVEEEDIPFLINALASSPTRVPARQVASSTAEPQSGLYLTVAQYDAAVEKFFEGNLKGSENKSVRKKIRTELKTNLFGDAQRINFSTAIFDEKTSGLSACVSLDEFKAILEVNAEKVEPVVTQQPAPAPISAHATSAKLIDFPTSCQRLLSEGLIFHAKVMKTLNETFNYIPALLGLLETIKSFNHYVAEADKAEFNEAINNLSTQPRHVSQLLVQLDQIVVQFKLDTHHLFGDMQQRILPHLVCLGQALENHITITKQDKSEAKFPADGNYDRIMHHVRLAEIKRCLGDHYNSQQKNLVMSLLSYLKFDNPGQVNIDLASDLLFDILSNPQLTLSDLLSRSKYQDDQLVSQQGVLVRAGRSATAAAEASRATGNSFGAMLWSSVSSVCSNSDLLTCLEQYRACKDPVSKVVLQNVSLVKKIITEVLLPSIKQYQLRWTTDDLDSRIKFTALADEEGTCTEPTSNLGASV